MGKWKYIFLSIFFFSQIGNTQNIPAAFKKTIDSLIKAGPKTYSEIDAVVRPSRKDTILMRYFVNEAIAQEYYSGQAYAYNQLGRRYRDISQFPQAIRLHQAALEAATKEDNLEFRVYSLNMLSVIHRRRDAIKSALDYSQEALELAETVKNPSEGLKRSINVSLNGIGNLYQTLEQYDLAIEQFRKSLKLENELGNKLGLAINHQNIGECQEMQGKLDEALKSYRTSLAYNEEINSENGKVICKNSIAHVYLAQHKLDEALEILEPTLLSSQEIGDKYLTSGVYINLGRAYLLKDNLKKAQINLDQGLAIAERHNLPSNISLANSYLSELAEKQGNYKKAMTYYKLAQEFEEKTINERNLRYVGDMISRYNIEKKNNEIEIINKDYEIVKLKLRKNQTRLLIGGFALILLTGVFYILYRQYQLKNDKKLLTLEQSMLRSQMNPHFLFNSLNSIKLYIINNDKKNAVHYLNKFSKLVRKILEASSLKEIPLAEELETVELYMNIENIRFSNEINFKITIDKDIDIHTIKIPSLILQPFLENALWHGLSSKTGEKSIDLHVSRGNNNFIDISITDNGVGRDAAETIKKSKVLKRKSVGIEITKERLANFAKDYQNTFDVTIIDLFDEKKKATGTKVVLHLPTI
ncbi:tetratricopeptide repeat protein [Maribacter polysiphoniae]|uniref:Tetratricopeptide repeat protein n=1 Tax=Maribacter polysiphoniae TaxID=429344 RepID=A0A316E4K7_9FLAO|nr:tetratricopeptide repeat protein [Maribacter polysiphoniae]MBD1259880.1 tetratricopeptide repeat protein [Maribacter polysiphoniae]PWK25334.1 tetratricopeptide repeat protein [Maribacter polysiphoniae]